MSISATGSFISQDTIDEWMQAHVSDAYSEMRTGMDVSGHRSDAESALNNIKAKLAAAKNNGGQTDGHLADDMQNALDQYGDVAGVKEVLGAMLSTVSDEHVVKATNDDVDARQDMPPIKLSGQQVDDWTNQISDVVDGLGRDDQLGMIHLNTLTSHINQAEQLATAIEDSRSKTLDAIINRIG